MAGLLNFDPNRELEFSPGRPLEFDSRRRLEFDAGRELDFNEDRDLGFGRRGVVFRGFVCPICGGLVTEDAKQCNECGTVFDRGARAAAPPAKATPTPIKTRGPAAPPRIATPREGTQCAFCSAKLKRTDTFCWNCGKRVAEATETVKLPTQKVQPVTRAWRGER